MTVTDMKQPDTHKIVSVGLGARSYDIHIGPELLINAADYIAPFVTNRKIIIISDETVGALYEDKLAEQLKPLSRDCMVMRVPAGKLVNRFSNFQHFAKQYYKAELTVRLS